MQSMQSFLGGGIAFDTPVEGMKQAQADPKIYFSAL